MKKIRNAFMILTALAAFAALAASCSQLLDSPASGNPAGRVTLTVSAGTTGSDGTAARTVLPAGVPSFSRYELVFSGEDFEDISIPAASGIENGGISQELEAGEWTAAVRAYRRFTPANGMETEYLAARGESEPFTVKAGQATPVKVYLAPIPAGPEAPAGIFTYKATFPAGVSGALTLGTAYSAGSLSSGAEVSVEIASGYYDLFICLTRGTEGSTAALTAWAVEKVHIYSGLESRAEFAFEAEDFAETLYLAGTLALPEGTDWEDITEGTIAVYSGADYTGQIGTPVSVQPPSWIVGVPVLYAGSTIYLKANLTGAGVLYTGETSAGVTGTGTRGIAIAVTGGGPQVPTVPTVSAVSVSPETVIVVKGETQEFSATVSGANNPAQTVTWMVEGGTGTSISDGGILSVAAGETAASLTVRATSTVDDSKSGTAVVTLTGGEPTVSAVSVNPAASTVVRGETLQFSAAVSGTNNPAQTVTWDVEGGSMGTSISGGGILTVAANETATTLTVLAVSTVDTSKSGAASVTVIDTTAPAIVSNLTGTAGDGQITLNWTDPADTDLASIEITFTPAAAGVAQPIPVNKGTQTMTVTGLNNGTTYAFTLKTVDTWGNKSAGTVSDALRPLAPTGVVTIEFTGLPQDETITLTSTDGELSWADNTALTVSIGETFDAYQWELDGAALGGQTGQSLTLNTGELAVKQHSLTVFVTKGAGEISLTYTKRLIFTVTQ
jgi:hypothetical protein